MEKKGNRLRNGFNEYAKEKGWPAFMTGVGSMFQIHLANSAITEPRDMLNRLETPLADLQLYLRLNGVFIPWIHLAFISAAHSDADVDEVLRVHKVSVEACLSAYGVI
jgi:glutamate-1-semialdehyde aminotransferase